MGYGVAGALALRSSPLLADAASDEEALEKAISELETWLTAQDDFRDVSRGKPKPHSLSDEQKQEVGLTRDSWRLNVVSDPEHPADVEHPLTGESALDFSTLLELGKEHAVRFAKVMTCLNIGCPLGTGIWEGVPLRTVLWMTKPKADFAACFLLWLPQR